MQSFAEQLGAVRKERHITQEQLAQEINVSRTTISRWEKGIMMPDIDTIKQLSKVLNYNFFTVEGLAEEAQIAPEAEEIPAQPEEHTAQETAVQQTESTPRKRKFVLPAVLGAVLLCAVLIVCLLTNKNGQPAQNQQANNTPTQQPVAQQANVIITPDQNPCPISYVEEMGGDNWFYVFCFEETAGVSFTASTLTETLIDNDGIEYPQIYVVDHIRMAWGEDTLYPAAPRYWRGGIPYQDLKGIRVTLKGTDANGNELEFEGYVELAQKATE